MEGRAVFLIRSEKHCFGMSLLAAWLLHMLSVWNTLLALPGWSPYPSGLNADVFLWEALPDPLGWARLVLLLPQSPVPPHHTLTPPGPYSLSPTWYVRSLMVGTRVGLVTLIPSITQNRAGYRQREVREYLNW